MTESGANEVPGPRRPETDRSLSQRWHARPPRYLYRYLPVSDVERRQFARELIQGRQLWLSSVLDFNDPFDCLPELRVPSRAATAIRLKRDRARVRGLGPDEVGDEALRNFLKMTPRQLREFASQSFRKTVGDIGIACFSETPEDVLMWSHYGNSHKGICVRFDTTVWPIESPFTLLMQVAYGARRPVFNFPSNPKVSRTDEMFEALTTKALFWEKEKEWRLLVNNRAHEKILLPPGLVTGVIMGARADDELKSLVQSWSDPGVSILQAEVAEKTYNVTVSITGR